MAGEPVVVARAVSDVRREGLAETGGVRDAGFVPFVFATGAFATAFPFAFGAIAFVGATLA